MEKPETILAPFEPISLKQMDGVQLMNRTDTKFIFPRHHLNEILSGLNADYRVLEVNGNRISNYETLYYDTPDFLFFRRHRAGKRNRYKVRMRSYVESNLNFLEVKMKTNKERTDKERTRIEKITEQLAGEQRDFIRRDLIPAVAHLADTLEPKIWNHFKRITLVHRTLPERITIDLDLGYRVNGNTVDLEGLVVAEVKQERKNRHSTFMQALKRRHIRPESISKYCIGISLLCPQVRSNSFKEKILKIKKIQNGVAA